MTEREMIVDRFNQVVRKSMALTKESKKKQKKLHKEYNKIYAALVRKCEEIKRYGDWSREKSAKLQQEQDELLRAYNKIMEE